MTGIDLKCFCIACKLENSVANSLRYVLNDLTYVGQLGFVESGPGGDFVVFFISTQSVDLQLEEVYVGHLRVRFVAVVFGVLPSPLLVARVLNHRLVVVANVYMPSLKV